MSQEHNTRVMLERISVLEKRASSLHAENTDAFEANRELFRRMQEINSCLITSESMVERLVNGSSAVANDDDSDYSSPTEANAHRPKNTGSVTSRLNRFEILLDEFCSEFDKSDDESDGSLDHAKFSIQVEPKVPHRQVLGEIGQRSLPKPIHRGYTSASSVIQSPTCLKLSLSTTPSHRGCKQPPVPSRLRLHKPRIPLDPRLLPLAPTSPSLPLLASPIIDEDDIYSISSCDAAEEDLSEKRRQLCMRDDEYEKSPSLITSLINSAPARNINESLEPREPPALPTRAPSRKYQFTSDAEFYADKHVAVRSSSPDLHGCRSVSNLRLNRKASTFSLLNNSPVPAAPTAAVTTTTAIDVRSSSSGVQGEAVTNSLKMTMKKDDERQEMQQHKLLAVDPPPKGVLRSISSSLWRVFWGSSSENAQTEPMPAVVEASYHEGEPEAGGEPNTRANQVEPDLTDLPSQTEPAETAEREDARDREDTNERSVVTSDEAEISPAEGTTETVVEREIDDYNCTQDERCNEEATCGSVSSRPSLSKRASWIFSSSSISTVPTEDSDDLTISKRSSWMSVFRKRTIVDDYVSFPTFNASQFRGFRLDRALADTQVTWPNYYSSYSRIDSIAYNSSLTDSQKSAKGRKNKEVSCTPVDESLLRDALSQYFQ